LNRTILIVEPLTVTVITVVNGHADAARRYRRGEQGRKKWGWRTRISRPEANRAATFT
jgi:hypothetical protein